VPLKQECVVLVVLDQEDNEDTADGLSGCVRLVARRLPY